MHAKLTIATSTGETLQKLIGNTAILGRGNVHVRIDGNPQVSRFHALLRCHNNHQYQIIDLGSRNGTFVGHTRVIFPLSVSDEAYLRLGGPDGVEIHLQQVWGEADDELAYLTIDTSNLGRGAVLVSHIGDFARWQRNLPEPVLARKFGAWNRSAISAVENLGGVVDKFVQEAMLSYWISSDETNAAQLALEAGAQLVAMGERTHWSDEPGPGLSVRAIVHAGKLSIGLGPKPDHDAAASGPTIDAAWRLQKAAARLGERLLLSSDAIALLPQFASSEMTAAGEVDAGGHEPIRLYAAQVVVEEEPNAGTATAAPGQNDEH